MFRPTLLSSFALLLYGCVQGGTDTQTVLRLGGETMGTTYHLVLLDGLEAERVQRGVDSLLVAINAEVNTYDPTSLISRLNRGDTVGLVAARAPLALQHEPGAHLAANLALAAKPVELSGGAFDPTVGPLVDYFGFGPARRDTSAVDSAEVARLNRLVGFGNVRVDTLDGGRLRGWMALPGSELDLSSLAKGYAVDQVLLLLLSDEFGSRNHYVEIGGEVRATGHSPRGDAWTVGINTPREGASVADLELVIRLEDLAVATSGNYRNFRERGGQRVWHTIDPVSGYPKATRLLSASVLAGDCATADAYATACMASGEAAAGVLAKANLAGCLIYADSSGRGFKTEYVGGFAGYVRD